MAPRGVVTPGCHLVVCWDVRLIVIKKFSSSRTSRARAQGVLYKAGPPIVSRVFLTELLFPSNALASSRSRLEKIRFGSTKPGNKNAPSRVLRVDSGCNPPGKTHNLARRSKLSCSRTLEIDSYVDGETGPSAAAAVRQHLEECAACSRSYRYLVALRSSLRDSSLYYRTPLELKMRVRSLLQTDAEAEAARRPMLPW